MYDWAELRHFRNLLAILERQGFRAAAEELHTSQPGLTVQARRFQENASIRLFQKTKSGRIRPTETGIAFMSLARELLETRDEVIDTLIAIERGEIKTFAIYAGAVICFGGLIFAGIRMMSGRFQDAIPGLFGALFGAGVLGWGAGWIGSLTGQSM